MAYMVYYNIEDTVCQRYFDKLGGKYETSLFVSFTVNGVLFDRNDNACNLYVGACFCYRAGGDS